jgi:hypothetical protein
MTKITEKLRELNDENVKLVEELVHFFAPHEYSQGVKDILNKIKTIKNNSNEMQVEIRVVDAFIEGTRDQ